MQRRPDIPRDRLRENFANVGRPEPRRLLARCIAQQEQSAGRDARGEFVQQCRLIVRGEVVQHIEQGDVALKRRQLFPRILLDEVDAAVSPFAAATASRILRPSVSTPITGASESRSRR